MNKKALQSSAAYIALTHDLARYPRRSWLSEQSWWAVVVYRCGQMIDERPAGITRKLLERIYWLTYTAVETATGITLTKYVRAGGGLRIHHFGTIVIHPGVSLGSNVTLRQGITIGERAQGQGVPTLEDEVEVGAHAQILGPIRIGRGAKIGALALVIDDVPPGASVFADRALVVPPKSAS